MITRDEALERARAWMSEGREDRPEIGLHEFELGWVAWPIVPVDPSRPPASTGGPQIVVDRESGEITTWPPLPAPMIAEQYSAAHAAEDPFPPDVSRVLVDAGWFRGRDVTSAVDAWAEEHAAALSGSTFFPAARAALNEFGGLVLPQYDLRGKVGGGFTSYLYPAKGDLFLDRSEGFAEERGVAVFPLGLNDDDGELAMDEEGRVFFLHWSDAFFLGANIDQALVSLIRGGDWPTADDEGWPL